jgi:hypothetical protein
MQVLKTYTLQEFEKDLLKKNFNNIINNFKETTPDYLTQYHVKILIYLFMESNNQNYEDQYYLIKNLIKLLHKHNCITDLLFDKILCDTMHLFVNSHINNHTMKLSTINQYIKFELVFHVFSDKKFITGLTECGFDPKLLSECLSGPGLAKRMKPHMIKSFIKEIRKKKPNASNKMIKKDLMLMSFIKLIDTYK